ncbi:MAG TPA: MmgE/PrpD family protein [Ramlibacter sp.]|nr:MmgE/PrpD family protein [Ramlibacter sp.]
MSNTIIERLAAFATSTRFQSLPYEVIGECKRDMLDAIGCALSGVDQGKGRRGIACALRLGGSAGAATIMGTDERRWRQPGTVVRAPADQENLIDSEGPTLASTLA